jgi:hypothetical protein
MLFILLIIIQRIILSLKKQQKFYCIFVFLVKILQKTLNKFHHLELSFYLEL